MTENELQQAYHEACAEDDAALAVVREAQERKLQARVRRDRAANALVSFRRNRTPITPIRSSEEPRT